MAYVYEPQDGPFWWIGFIDEAGDPVRKVATRPDGTKIRRDGKTAEQVRDAPDSPSKPRDVKQARKDAERAADDAERLARDRREGRVDQGLITGITFQQLADRYLAEHVTGMRSEKSVRSRFKHLTRHFGSRAVVSIESTEIAPYLKMMLRVPTPEDEKNPRSGKVLSPSSVKHIRKELCSVFNFAIQARMMRTNPVQEGSEVAVPRQEIRVIEGEDVGRLLRAADPAWRGFIAVGVYCGLRKGEVIGLRCRDVDLKAGIITVQKSYSGPTKGNKERVVPIPPELVPFLKVELGRQRSELLFPNSKGKMWSINTKTEVIIRRAATAAGLVEGYDHVCRRNSPKWGHCGFSERRADDAPSRCPRCQMKLWIKPICVDIKFKDTRSTYGTAAYEATGDERYVVDTLGHSDPRITDLYRKTKIEHLRRQGAKLSYGVPEEISQDSLRVDEAAKNERGQVLRIPSTSQQVSKLRDEGFEPTTFGSGVQSVMLQASSPVGIPEESLTVGGHPHRQAGASSGRNSQLVTQDSLRKLDKDGEPLLSPSEAAIRQGRSASTIRKWIDEGVIAAIRQNGRLYVRERDLGPRLAPLPDLGEPLFPCPLPASGGKP